MTITASTLHTVQQTSIYETVFTFAASVLFVVVYTTLAPWWRSQLGRNLVAFDSALALSLFPSVLHHAFGVNVAENSFFAWFTIVCFGCVPLIILWRTAITITLQLSGKSIHLDETDE